jgi:hypothetical protein
MDKEILQAAEALEALNLTEISEIDRTLGVVRDDPEEVAELQCQRKELYAELKQVRQRKREVLRKIMASELTTVYVTGSPTRVVDETEEF